MYAECAATVGAWHKTHNPQYPAAGEVAAARLEIGRIATTLPDAKVLPAVEMMRRIKALRVIRAEYAGHEDGLVL